MTKEFWIPKEQPPLKVLTCSIHGIVFYNGVDGQKIMATSRNSLDYAKHRHLQDFPDCQGVFNIIKVPKAFQG